MKDTKKDNDGVFPHIQPTQKRKRKQANDENKDSPAKSTKTCTSEGVVFGDVTNIPLYKGDCSCSDPLHRTHSTCICSCILLQLLDLYMTNFLSTIFYRSQ